MKFTKETIEWIKKGGEVDYTANYRREDRPWETGRISLRWRNGRFELYLIWLRTKDEEILHVSKNIEDVVEWGNEFMHKLGYKNWKDEVV